MKKWFGFERRFLDFLRNGYCSLAASFDQQFQSLKLRSLLSTMLKSCFEVQYDAVRAKAGFYRAKLEYTFPQKMCSIVRIFSSHCNFTIHKRICQVETQQLSGYWVIIKALKVRPVKCKSSYEVKSEQQNSTILRKELFLTRRSTGEIFCFYVFRKLGPNKIRENEHSVYWDFVRLQAIHWKSSRINNYRLLCVC